MKISKFLYWRVTFSLLYHSSSDSSDVTFALLFSKMVSFPNLLKNLKIGCSSTEQLRGSQEAKVEDHLSSSVHVLIWSPTSSYPGSQTTTISVPETNVSEEIPLVASLSFLLIPVRSGSNIAFSSIGISTVVLSRFLKKILASATRSGQGHVRRTQSGMKPVQVPFAEHCSLNSVSRL